MDKDTFNLEINQPLPREKESYNPVYVHSQEEYDLMRGVLPPEVPIKLVPARKVSLESIKSPKILDDQAEKALSNSAFKGIGLEKPDPFDNK